MIILKSHDLYKHVTEKTPEGNINEAWERRKKDAGNYHQSETIYAQNKLQYRVWNVDEVINYVRKKRWPIKMLPNGAFFSAAPTIGMVIANHISNKLENFAQQEIR